MRFNKLIKCLEQVEEIGTRRDIATQWAHAQEPEQLLEFAAARSEECSGWVKATLDRVKSSVDWEVVFLRLLKAEVAGLLDYERVHEALRYRARPKLLVMLLHHLHRGVVAVALQHLVRLMSELECTDGLGSAMFRPSGIKRLAELLADEEPWFARNVVVLLQSQLPSMRLHLARYVSGPQPSEWTELGIGLIPFLEDGKVAVPCAKLIGMLKVEAAATRLRLVATSGRGEAVPAAIEALGRVGTDSASEGLWGLLESRPKETEHIVRALADIPRDSATFRLVSLHETRGAVPWRVSRQLSGLITANLELYPAAALESIAENPDDPRHTYLPNWVHGHQCPWEPEDVSRHDFQSTRGGTFSVTSHRGDSAHQAQVRYESSLQRCPCCGRPPWHLHWRFYYSNQRSWRGGCGRAGWLVSCDSCERVVSSFVELMN